MSRESTTSHTSSVTKGSLSAGISPATKVTAVGVAAPPGPLTVASQEIVASAGSGSSAVKARWADAPSSAGTRSEMASGASSAAQVTVSVSQSTGPPARRSTRRSRVVLARLTRRVNGWSSPLVSVQGMAPFMDSGMPLTVRVTTGGGGGAVSTSSVTSPDASPSSASGPSFCVPDESRSRGGSPLSVPPVLPFAVSSSSAGSTRVSVA